MCIFRKGEVKGQDEGEERREVKQGRTREETRVLETEERAREKKRKRRNRKGGKGKEGGEEEEGERRRREL